MKFIKGTWNFISGLIAVLLSIALILVLLAIPAMFAVQKATEPEGLQKVVQLLTAKVQPSTDPEEILIQELLQSNAAKEFLELYREDLFAQVRGEKTVLSGKAIQQIVQDNMNELVPMLRKLMHSAEVDISILSDAQLAELTQQMMAYYGDQLLRKLPNLNQLGIQPLSKLTPENIFVVEMEVMNRLLSFDFHREDIPLLISQAVILLNDYLGLKLLGMVAVLLSLLIVLFRLGKGFRCVSWIGCNYLIGGGVGSVLGLYGKFSIKQLLTNSAMSPIEDSLQYILKWFTNVSAAILVLGIVFLIISGCGNSVITKRRQRKLVQ